MNDQNIGNNDETDRTIWCGKIHNNADEELLYELFLQAGPIENIVTIPYKEGTNKLPNQPKDINRINYAFITYVHAISVFYAKELLNGVSLYGLPIKVQFRKNSLNTLPLGEMLKPQFILNDQLKQEYYSRTLRYA